MINAKTFLEKRYSEDMELEDAIHTAILTLKEGFDGQIAANNIEEDLPGCGHQAHSVKEVLTFLSADVMLLKLVGQPTLT